MKITYEMTRHWLGDDDIYEILTDIANGDYKPKVLKSDILSTSDDLKEKLPDGLQKYIDGVGLNILYRNYHKSTNGIWSRAEIEEEFDGDDGFILYVVNIDFGCQDDTRNESYRERVDVYKKDDEWKWEFHSDGSVYPQEINTRKEDPADRDDKHYHEEQDHIAMEKAKENK